MTIGRQFSCCHNFAVDDDLDRNITSLLNSTAFDMPIRFIIQPTISNRLRQFCRRFLQQSRCIEGYIDRLRCVDFELADGAIRLTFTDAHIVDPKIQNMTEPIAAIAASITQAFDPVVIV